MGPPHRSSASPICPSPLHWRRRSLPTSHSVAASSPLCPAGADAGGRGGLPVGAAASGEASGHLVDMLSTLLTLWVSLLPMMWFIQRQMSAGGSAEKRRRSRKQGVGFGDVQGVDEAKEELVEGNEEIDNLRGIGKGSIHTSTLIVSEFVGCSPSLSGAFRVNPWSVEDVADALYHATDLTQSEKKLRHDKHYRYVSSHDVAYWAHSFAQDLDRACKDHYSRRCWTTGFGLNFRVIALSPGFRRLSLEHFASSYKKANRRLVFLDYDGTLVPQSSVNKAPSAELISVLNNLCNDLKNCVFIVSGRGRTSLSEWFASCEKLGIAAEHGYFIRWNKAAEWETSSSGLDCEWKHIADPVMHVYKETTDGSFIEPKETALVWHYQDADHDFGSCQAKELVSHLERVLANEPVVVKRGHQIVEVKPQGVSKGVVVDKVIRTLVNNGKAPDFLMCIGNDRSDEDMFESINNATSRSVFPAIPEVFACSVGQKASKAKYYVDGCSEVTRLLKGVTAISSRRDAVSHSHVTLKDILEVVT